MKEFTYTIKDEQGIHARPAGELVKAAAAYPCKVTISKDGIRKFFHDHSPFLFVVASSVSEGSFLCVSPVNGFIMLHPF